MTRKSYDLSISPVRCSHTHTHTFNGPLSGTTRVGRYQKGETNLDFTEARDSEWQWHQLGHMLVCTSLQADNHASTPPLSLSWEIQKSHFSTLLLFIHISDYLHYHRRKQIAAVVLHLHLLFSASYYLHSPSTASGACYSRSTCIDTDMLKLSAAACCDMG